MSKSVLVIGGGIAGIQASLDLANRGMKTYVVEKQPSIGGRMAQLDKTFPTNDCSICILAPKMADCYQHENIELITCAEVEDVQGTAGDFKVKVRKHTRYVDESKCTGCNDCVAACPVELPDEFNMRLGKRKAIYRMFTQAVPNKFLIDKRGDPPCRTTCPAGVNAMGYIALIRAGKYKEALALEKERNPFPGICGRICHHPCEGACNRKDLDEPVAICELKRFIADYALEHGELESPVADKNDEKVAVVGAGPGGLSAAYYLARMGYGVTVFEALPVAGGMLAVGIPDYRLPREILNGEIEAITKLGVEIKTNTPIGKDMTIKSLLDHGYKSVFIATGAHTSTKLRVDGEDLKGVFHGVDFLRDVALGKKPELGKKVAVIGGGNVAIDSVRTAARLGSEAFILYRRSKEEMPAYPWEIEEAEEEGIEIQFLAAPAKVIGKDGKVTGLECVKMELGEPDESGRRRPVPIKGSEYTIELDSVLVAIGQSPNTAYMTEDMQFKINKNGTVEVDDKTLMTSVKGVFAGGDNVLGPASAVEAINHGRMAAISIDRFIRGEKLDQPEVTEEPHVIKYDELSLSPAENVEIGREKPTYLQATERVKNFDEVITRTFTEEEAKREASRCLNCAGCSDCHECIKVCKPEAVNYDLKDEIIDLDVGAIIVATGFDVWDPTPAKEYGYPTYPNVYTAMEFERLINAAGPTGGHIERRSDGKRPMKLGFIQCVGSRNTQTGHPYCCSVCCMHSTKEAMLAYEHHNDMESFVFYKDLRTFGKGFNEYMERAKRDYNVTYINSDATVRENPKTNNPIVVYDKAGKQAEIEVDMVVLATTLVPRPESKKLAELLGVDVTEFGFLESIDKVFAPIDTKTKGIFIAGYCHEPMDIPEAVAEASGAAERAAETIVTGGGQ